MRVFALALLGLFAFPAFAQDGSHSHGPDPAIAVAQSAADQALTAATAAQTTADTAQATAAAAQVTADQATTGAASAQASADAAGLIATNATTTATAAQAAAAAAQVDADAALVDAGQATAGVAVAQATADAAQVAADAAQIEATQAVVDASTAQASADAALAAATNATTTAAAAQGTAVQATIDAAAAHAAADAAHAIADSVMMLAQSNALRLDALEAGPNGAPVADIQQTPIANPGDTGIQLTLDSCPPVSSDPDGDPLTFAWTLQVPAGSASGMSNATACNPTFTPDLDGVYTPGLTVTDTGGLSDSASYVFTASTPAPPGNFAALCAEPGVVLCDDFETGGNWDLLYPITCGPNPAVVNGELVFTATAACGEGIAGDVHYDHAPISGTAYYNVKVFVPIGWVASQKSMTGGNGSKFIQWLGPGESSCDDTSVNFVNVQNRAVPQLTRTCGGKAFSDQIAGSGDWDIQPVGLPGVDWPNSCTRRHFTSSNPIYEPQLAPKEPPCTPFREGEWVTYELEVTEGAGVKMWEIVAGVPVLFTDTPHDYEGNGALGPRGRLYITHYNTNHNAGAGTDSFWKMDELIVSTDCIESC